MPFVLSCTLEKSTSAGGSGVGSHMKISSTLMPRRVGDEAPGCAKSDRKLTWVRMPERSDDSREGVGRPVAVEAYGTL